MAAAEHRNRGLDGLRGIAALIVVYFHAILHYDAELVNRVYVASPTIISGMHDWISKVALALLDGQASVAFFFVLSGTVLRLSLERSAASSPAMLFGQFVIKRIFRIMPAVVVCMVAYFTMTKVMRTAGLPGVPNFNWTQLWQNALLIKPAMHGPSLSVQTELLAVPFLIVFFLITRRSGALGMFLCTMYALLGIHHAWFTFTLPYMHAYLFLFAIGMLVADRRFAPMLYGVTGTQLFGIAVITYLSRHIVGLQDIMGAVVQGATAGVLVAGVMYSRSNWVCDALCGRTCQFLGRISYSLYLFHVPALVIVWTVSDLYITRPIWPALEMGLAAGTLALALAIPVSVACERFVELPAIRAGRRLCTWLDNSSRRARKIANTGHAPTPNAA